MSWSYRLVHRVVNDEEEYAIHEYYGNEHGITERAIPARGETVEDVRWALERMLEALGKPVLEHDSFGVNK